MFSTRKIIAAKRYAARMVELNFLDGVKEENRTWQDELRIKSLRCALHLKRRSS